MTRFFAVLVLMNSAPLVAADIPPTGQPIKLFDGTSLEHFDTFLRTKGLNNDPDRVFQIRDGVVPVKYWVNGKVVNEGSAASLTCGKILFQSEGAEVFFRNIELRPLLK